MLFFTSMRPRVLYNLISKFLKRPRKREEIELCIRLLFDKNYAIHLSQLINMMTPVPYSFAFLDFSIYKERSSSSRIECRDP